MWWLTPESMIQVPRVVLWQIKELEKFVKIIPVDE
jgi:hypothetical protein